MSKILRYQISDWSQITECLSNNSRNLYLSLSKPIDGDTLKGLILSVEHPNYGTLFAAMIKGSGVLVSAEDEDGVPIPFLTTEEILKQIEKFGFIVKYDLKSNLPDQVIAYLSMLYNLGYDKINIVGVKTKDRTGAFFTKSTVIVMKSCPETMDLMKFGRVISTTKFNHLLELNVVMNVTNEPDMVWDWITYMANIKDILEENIDPTDDFETETNVKSGVDTHTQVDPILIPEGYTLYTDDNEEGE